MLAAKEPLGSYEDSLQINSAIDPAADPEWWKGLKRLSIAEAAKVLGCTYALALRLTHLGVLKEAPPGSHWVTESSIRRLLRRGGVFQNQEVRK